MYTSNIHLLSRRHNYIFSPLKYEVNQNDITRFSKSIQEMLHRFWEFHQIQEFKNNFDRSILAWRLS